MHIVFLQDDFPPMSFGGAGFSVYELARGMKKAGHEVSVITTCRKKEDEGEFDFEGLHVHRVLSDYPERWRAYLSLYNPPVVRQVEHILKKIRPDIVHVNNVHYHLSYQSIKVAKKYARGVVFTARDVMSFSYTKLNTGKFFERGESHLNLLDLFFQAKKRFNPFRNLVVRRFLRYTDKIFSVSHSLASALASNNIDCGDVIHTGTDVSLWESSFNETNAFVEKYKLANKNIILFGGRISEAKGGDVTIKALARVLRNFPNTVLLVMGSSDENVQRMINEAKDEGFSDAICVTGWIKKNETRIAYSASNIVLVPSLCLDAFPRVVIEAMASGKPVIGTCYGGAPEIIEDGVTGYVVNPLYPERIAEKIIDLLENPEKAKLFGEAGRERIRIKFNIEDVVKEYIVGYNSAIATQKT